MNADATNICGMTSFHFAVAFGHVDVVTYLLRNDSAYCVHNVANNHTTACACSNTALHSAGFKCSLKTLEDGEPEFYVSNKDVMTAVQVVIEYGRLDIVVDVIDKLFGADTKELP
jgi:ankyrin repeat protein